MPSESVTLEAVSKPLGNSSKIRTILVTQPYPDSTSPYFEIAKKYGVKIDFREFIQIEGVDAKDFRKERINLNEFTAIIFTSRMAIDHFFRIANELRMTVPDTTKYFCMSESVAYYLQKYVVYRKRKVFYGKQTISELIDVIKKNRKEKFMLPCTDIIKQEMADTLEKNKIDYKKAVIYKTLCSDLSNLSLPNYDMLVLFTPSGLASLYKNFPEFRQNSTKIAAFGPTTCQAVIEAGLQLDVQAPLQNAPSMTMAIEQYLKHYNK